ncbi:glycosyltransferase [Flavobacteriaceae bacterium]|nr:glycosyltransferase [Flavobacteriaceae bacterium]
MSTKPTLAVVAISCNEEVDLPGFLEHLVTWVDGIVIVNDGSKDATDQIASKYGPKINFIKSKREACRIPTIDLLKKFI